MAATRGTPWSAVARRPPSERGKSSYQAENTARSRSTHRAMGSDGVTSTGSGTEARTAARLGWRASTSPPPSSAWVRRAWAAFFRGLRSDGGHVVGPPLEQAGALLQLDGDVLPRGLLDEDVAAPRAEAVGPRLDAHLVAAEGAGLDGRRPPVVAGVGHGRVPPLRLALRPVRDPGREQVVAVAEDVGRDGGGMPDDRLGRIPPGRCARARVDDDNPTSHPTGVPPKAVAQPAAVARRVRVAHR